ncbi:cytochrome c oxidase assembly factor 7 homolog [Teleopsis dalmanni]|uniref:cytochrome c oxidase assembly factor 7 homolog n=1 Tax=Teleopsis dalmanni TaxID=139649 RepID=UPI0018CEE564|nr:cytochrome c oxidase assembly factor 7 homolog [Teleopsis dalmanni]
MSFDLKKESDVKEYIEKLGIEYRFGCYSEKKPEVCHLLGDYLEGIKKDFEKAAKVYKSTCDDYGYAKSCYKFGNYSFLGKGKSGSKGDPRSAYNYYEKGCNLNDSESCLHSGLLLVSRSMPKQMDRDVPKGLEYLTKSCDMDNGTACFYLSGMHISGVHKNPESTTDIDIKSQKANDFIIQKDMKKAFDYAYKACELKNMYACANLSQMYARGDGTTKDESQADKYKKMAVQMQEELKKVQPTLQFQQGVKD